MQFGEETEGTEDSNMAALRLPSWVSNQIPNLDSMGKSWRVEFPTITSNIQGHNTVGTKG